ncbi:protein inscuteable homolog [Nylanderia fulva]|uniref:protein inscuteable homolog n=1 Tax=Nylanderia fulva TaxID=613905 RepID=UPI0010FB9C84|nr:protein inscuteable homolog [Nylanderia fulva]XP_029178326.1 protein inscuteable homolog [Nylanderia fulva]
MSAFKRYQSKVFWEQMASRDLENEVCFTERNEPSRKGNEEEKEEDSASRSENDTIDGANITAIHVCNQSDESPKQDACQISLTCDESMVHRRTTEMDVQEERKIVSGNRSYSPSSQDLRSQDSGFSDSERSDCSEAYENVTPRRKLRRRRRRTRQHRMQSTGIAWLEEGSPSMPKHTSTPKHSRTFAKDRFEQSARRERINEERSDESKVSVSLENSECLGDFLYASEPPEDSVQLSSSSARSRTLSTDPTTDAITAGREVLNSSNYRQSSSLRAWLTDLRIETVDECSSTLQSKTLPRIRMAGFSGGVHARDLKMMSSAATAAASKLLVSADRFEQHYRSIVEKITRLEGGRSEMELLRSIEEAAFMILSQLGAPPPRRIQQGSLRSIIAQLQSMKNYVDDTIDTRLDFYIEKIVRGLEEAPRQDDSVARGALAALTALGLSDSRAGSSIARCSGIKALLTCLISTGRASSNDFVALTLRALASVCSSTTAIEYFARDGGPEILTDLLEVESISEKEKIEATALVVQITAPWTDAWGLPCLEPFANSLIPSLNRLIESSDCAQTLLLAAAALNHLSKSRLCVGIILEQDSVRKLLRSVKKSVGDNVWLMEQVAALIGELARVPEGRSYLAGARASVALVSFLRMRPPGLEDAYRRLELTAAAALTRLCVEPEIARQVVAIGGGDCLTGPCRVNNIQTEEEEMQVEAGFLKYTRSLRRACKKAAKQIGIAKAKDHSTLD